ncbi:MAG: aldo/keto reductase [Treponema sp.]|nr:aldo/keto reductase [Treponema sp.]
MKKIDLGKGGLVSPAIALGCMRMRDLSTAKAMAAIAAAMESGINFFDHADIYGLNGAAETIFGKAAKEMGLARESMIIQTKCGLARNADWTANAAFDFSKAHIIASVEGSLSRLGMDYVDLLALHRPDALVEPEEVAAAFDTLRGRGLVRHFGVSNHTSGQIELLKKYLGDKIIVNQLQFGIGHMGMVDFGLNMNMKTDASIDRDGGVLDYCRLNDITIQAWSPYLASDGSGVFVDNPKFPKLNATLAEIAGRHGISKDALGAAWILRHPAKMQVIIGSMNPGRIRDIASACDISLSREDWYGIYIAAGNPLP